MTESPVRERMEPILVTGFLGMILFLLYFAHPLALLPPSLNFDTMVIRLSVMIALAIPAIALAVVGWRRQSLNASLFSGLLIVTGMLIVIMPNGSGGKAFAFTLPVSLLMVPASLFLLAVKRVTLPRPLVISASIFCLGVTVQLFRNPGNADLIIPFYAMALVPVCVSILLSQQKMPGDFLSYAAAGIFGLSLYYGLAERVPIGISGNPNWFACTFLGVLPWTIWLVFRWLHKFPCWARWLTTGVLLGLPSAWVLYKCNTRAAYLAVGLMVVVVVFFSLRRVWLRISWLVICAALVVGASLLYFGYIKQALGQDVRAPLWFSSARLAAQDGPSLITGVGPRNIQYLLPDLLAESGYHSRFVASEWVKHPHNELAHVVLNLGIPAGLAWLVLLTPLLANPVKLKGLSRVAWYSAVPMLVLGCADKGLQWGPAILWFPLCLGVLWSTRIDSESRPTSEITGKVTLIALSLGTLSAILVVYFAYHQIYSSWYNRRGDQLSAFNRYELARDYYLKALGHVPNDVPLAYKVAATSLQHIRPFDAETTKNDIALAYQMNPNFAHINIFMGRYLLMTGRQEESLAFFLRDVELFPENVKSHQWLVHALLIGRNTDLLGDAQQALERKFNQRVFSFADIKGRDDLPVTWLNALDEGDWSAMSRELNTFLPALQAHRSIDPIEPWNSSRGWPRDFIGTQCHTEDIPFWKSVLFRENYRDEIRGHSEDPASLAWRIMDHVTIATPAAQWDYPHVVWKEGAGSVESCYSLLSWLSDGIVLMLADPKTQVSDSALVFPASTKSNTPVLQVYFRRRMVKFLSSDELADIVTTGNNSLYFPALPQEFLTRHHVLNALSNKVAAYRKQLDFATIPSIKYLKLCDRYPVLPKRITCWQPPVEAVRLRITLETDGDKE